MGRRLTPARVRDLVLEFARFVGAGVVNTLSSYLLFLGLNLALHYQLAYALAYASGIALSWFLNTRLVFRREGSWLAMLAFPAVYAVPYLLNIALLHALVELLAIPEWLAPLLLIVVNVPVTFALTRLLLGGSREPPPT